MDQTGNYRTRSDLVWTMKKVLLRTGYVHIAFSVGSKASVDTLTERLKGDGYQVVSGPDELPETDTMKAALEELKEI